MLSRRAHRPPPAAPQVAYHEAGHFLVAYLTGILPAGYVLTSLQAFTKYRVLNVQAGCRCGAPARRRAGRGLGA